MPPKDLSVRRSAVSTRADAQPRRSSTARQLITFVDSQDPNSRSAIQRHTAHHSNAQRRDARLQSLRTNRPRLLQWQRRPSADADASANNVASPQSSTSSASVSSGPGLRRISSTPGDVSTEPSTAGISSTEASKQATQRQRLTHKPAPNLTADPPVALVEDSEIEIHISGVCPFVQREIYRNVLRSIQNADVASKSLLLAYMRAMRAQRSDGSSAEADRNEAHRFYGQGTRLLRDRLTKPEMASSNENIQAVLLLIIYAHDAGSKEEVTIHIDALTRMLYARGGLDSLEAETDPTLILQLKGLANSRRGHLTLPCRFNCHAERRFPNGLTLPGQVDDT